MREATSVRTMRRLIVTTLFLIACGRGLPPEVAAQAPDAVLQMARARPVPQHTQARFNIKVRSKKLDLAGNVGGGLVTSRPGKLRFAILTPVVGTPMLSVISDNVGLAATIPKKKEHLVALDAESVVREATSGAAGLDDVLALMVGDLPFDEAKTKSRKKLDEETVRIVFVGPQKTLVTAVLDARLGVPRSLSAADKKGKTLLMATYEPFKDQDGYLMPTKVALEVPALDLLVELRYKSWKFPEEEPTVFSLVAPEDFIEASLEETVRKLAEGLVETGTN